MTGYLPGEGVLIVRWIEGRTFNEDDVGDERNLPRIAAVCRSCTRGRPSPIPSTCSTSRPRYLALVTERGFRLPPRYGEFADHAERIRAALAVAPEPKVPCNNDLLAANIIDDGDGSG